MPTAGWIHWLTLAAVLGATQGALFGQTMHHTSLVVQTGHGDNVRSVAYSPDGKYIATGSNDHSARLWSAETGKELRQYRIRQGEVSALAFSPDGKLILTGGTDTTAQLWDVATGAAIARFAAGVQLEMRQQGLPERGSATILSVAFSPNGQFIYGGTCEGVVRVWDVTKWIELQPLDLPLDSSQRNASDIGPQCVNGVGISPDGKYLLTRQHEGLLRIWSTQNGRLLLTVKRTEGAAFSPDSKRVLIGSLDDKAEEWDIESAKQIQSFIGHSTSVEAVAYSPDGKTILTGSMDSSARLWDDATGREIARFSRDTVEIFSLGIDGITAVAFSPDNRHFVTSFGSEARQWDRTTGRDPPSLVGHTRPIEAIAISPDKQYILTGSDDLSVRLWETATGNEIIRFEGTKPWYAADFSPDGRYALASNVGELRLWSIPDGREIARYAGYSYPAMFAKDNQNILANTNEGGIAVVNFRTGAIRCKFASRKNSISVIATSPDGHLVLSGSDDKIATLWNIANCRPVRVFEGFHDGIRAVAFSPLGRSIVISSNDAKESLWDINTGELLESFQVGIDEAVKSAAFLPDGKTLINATGGFLYLSNVASGNFERELSFYIGREFQDVKAPTGDVDAGNHNHARAMSVAKDGAFAAISSPDLTVAVLPLALDTDIVDLKSRAFPVTSVTTSITGHVLISSDGMRAHFWDLDNGKQSAFLNEHVGTISSFVFSSDGNYAVTGSKDKTAILWLVSSGKVLQRFEVQEEVIQAGFSPDDHFIWTLDNEFSDDKPIYRLRIWDPHTGKEIGSFVNEKSPKRAVLDGHNTLTFLWEKSEIKWENTTAGVNKKLAILAPIDDPINPINPVFLVNDSPSKWAASPNARYIATSSSQDDTHRIFVFDTEANQQAHVLAGHSTYVGSLAFSADSRFLLSSDLNTTIIWDVARGVVLQSLEDGFGTARFSPDGQFVTIFHRGDNVLTLWRLSDKKRIGFYSLPFSYTAGDNFAVAYSPDMHAIYIPWGNTTKVISTDTGTEVASLHSLEDGGWAVTDPDGRYDASDPDSTSSLYWVTDNLRTIDLGQLKQVYYTPGLLPRVLRGERLPLVAGMDSIALPPTLALAKSIGPTASSIQLAITDEGGGVGRLLIWVNDRLMAAMDHPLPSSHGNSTTIQIDLSHAPFLAGENSIRVIVYDATNRIASHDAIARYTKPSIASAVNSLGEVPATNGAGHFYAILIGTSKFADARMNLAFPARDAQSLEAALRLGAERLYGKENVWIRLLTTDATAEKLLPTKANIKAAFDEIHSLSKPEDTLLVYLSGHGAMSSSSRDVYYYLTTDARTLNIEDDPKLRDISTVSSDELAAWMREPVKTMPLKQVVILDTCAAGGAGQAFAKLIERREIPPDQRRAIEMLKDSTGTFILMGSAADAVSYEASKYGQGLLTYALLQGMRGESLNDSSRLDVTPWLQRAGDEVPLLARSIGGIQHPELFAPKGSSDFPVALLSLEDRAQIPLAHPKPQVLRVICSDKDGLDPLHLRDLIREQMRAINDPQARGHGRSDSPVTYIDSTDDDLPDAISPHLIYSLATANSLNVQIRLVLDGKLLSRADIALDASDPHQIASQLVAKMIAMATE